MKNVENNLRDEILHDLAGRKSRAAASERSRHGEYQLQADHLHHPGPGARRVLQDRAGNQDGDGVNPPVHIRPHPDQGPML